MITIGVGTRIGTRIAAGCWFRENYFSLISACLLDLYDTPLLHVTGGVWIVSCSGVLLSTLFAVCLSPDNSLLTFV